MAFSKPAAGAYTARKYRRLRTCHANVGHRPLFFKHKQRDAANAPRVFARGRQCERTVLLQVSSDQTFRAGVGRPCCLGIVAAQCGSSRYEGKRLKAALAAGGKHPSCGSLRGNASSPEDASRIQDCFLTTRPLTDCGQLTVGPSDESPGAITARSGERFNN
jgi:hypothetical protein